MTQTERILEILLDGRPHSTFELVEKAYESHGPSLARLGARIWDLKQKGYEIIGWRDPDNRKKYWYQLKPLPRPAYEVEENGQIYFM